MLAGLGAAPFAFWGQRRLAKPAALLAFVSVFPVAYAILRSVTLYNSERHFLFIYPPLVIISAAACSHVVRCAVGRRIAWASSLVVIACFVAEPVLFMWRAHPNEYVYFNPLIGGVPGASRKFDLDYWGNCLRETTLWMMAHRGPERPTLVTTNRGLAYEYLAGDPSYDGVYEGPVHFELLHLMEPEERDSLVKESVLHAVQVDGVPLCVVKKGALFGR